MLEPGVEKQAAARHRAVFGSLPMSHIPVILVCWRETRAEIVFFYGRKIGKLTWN
jgi:hypothetical protein